MDVRALIVLLIIGLLVLVGSYRLMGEAMLRRLGRQHGGHFDEKEKIFIRWVWPIAVILGRKKD